MRGVPSTQRHGLGVVMNPPLRRLAAVLVPGALALLLTACGGPPDPHATAPYPLNIPVAHRSPRQLTEGRLMMFPSMAARGLLAPLPRGLQHKVTNSSTAAQIRWSISVPDYAYTTAASPNANTVSVYSTGHGFQLAMLNVVPNKPRPAQIDCLEVRDLPGKPVSYGVTTLTKAPYLTQVNGCTGILDPASGWLPAWPTSTALYPPKTPIRVRIPKFAKVPPPTAATHP